MLEMLIKLGGCLLTLTNSKMGSVHIQNELQPLQVHLLRVLIQPPTVQIEGFEWASFNLPEGVFDKWCIAFTDLYLKGGTGIILGYLADDVKEVEVMRSFAIQSKSDEIWTNDGFLNSSFWETFRTRCRNILESRRLPTSRPNPDDWYSLIPEELD